MTDETSLTPPANDPHPETWYTPLTRVTPLSKAFAMGLFILLPFVGFLLGYVYKMYRSADEGVSVTVTRIAQGDYLCMNHKGGHVLTHKEMRMGAEGGIMDVIRGYPPINFDLHNVVVVSQGYKGSGGYSIEVARVMETEDAVVVYVHEKEPGWCPVTTMPTSPCDVVLIPRTDKPVSFVTKRTVVDCGRPSTYR